MQHDKIPPPTLLFIFGGSGDLNYRKLTPALFNLYVDEWMPEQFAIYGIGRSDYENEQYRKHLLEGIQKNSRRKGDLDGKWEAFAAHVNFLQMDASDPNAYSRITDCIAAKEKEFGFEPVVIFYMAVAPQLVPVIAKNLKQLPACFKANLTRIVVEKTLWP